MRTNVDFTVCSDNVMDRHNIEQHLLNQSIDPFNRQPLSAYAHRRMLAACLRCVQD